MVEKKQKGSNGEVVQKGHGKTVNISLRFTIKDWEIFELACQRSGKNHEEILCELAVKWAEDVMKAEQLPPG